MADGAKRVPVTCTRCGFKFARGSRNVVVGPSPDRGVCRNKAACAERKKQSSYRPR